MEEKVNTPENNGQKKLSYEELERVAQQLSQQANQLYEQLQKANLNNMFARLQFLFEVAKQPEVFHGDFYQNCIDEIETIMTLKPEEEKKEEEEVITPETKDTHID
jgi:hypothetical protein